MKVEPSTRRSAVFSIYRAYRRRHGSCLSLAELEREWKRTGLRRSDLQMALQDMTQRKLLLRRGEQGARLELTYLGECAMEALLFDQPLHLISDWMKLRRARLRRAAREFAGETLRSRRREDPAAG